MKVIASWSGGKDSCLAAYKARQAGHELACLLNFVSREYKRCCFHGIEAKLMRLQAELMGIPIFQAEVTADMKEYEREFKAAVRELKQKHGVEGMVFGDVYLDEHREWVERVCADLEIKPIEPLWGLPARQVVLEFIGAGFKSVVTSCKSDLFGREFVGRFMDAALVDELVARNICPCGENGEFHTFVVAGPSFAGEIRLQETEPILKKGFWEHWFLDIKRYETTEAGSAATAAPTGSSSK
ncbi:MAG: diphthine--ammonia ligase [Planctomycetota bacterium]|nr:diphthine--ammonia ligase [Planctomycetota bacterium]